MNWPLFYDIVGYIATALIVLSMLFKTTTFRGTMIMRVINLIGSVAFAIYGFGAGAIPTGVANALLTGINVVFIILECVDYKRCLKEEH